MTEQTDPTNGESRDNGKGTHDTPETMFDSIRVAANDLAERAGPTVRELSARAAELTATAAVKAGPFARRAGEAAADASSKLAETARGWAADLRRDAAAPASTETSEATYTAPEAPSAPVAEDVSPADLAAEEPSAYSQPVESTPSPAYEDERSTSAYGSGGTDEDEPTRPGI